MGSAKSAIPPIRVMTTESTVAKIGRSMKKRAIMAQPRSAMELVLRRQGWLWRLDRRRGRWARAGLCRSLLRGDWLGWLLLLGRLRCFLGSDCRLGICFLRLGGIAFRVPNESWHRPLFGVDGHAGPNLLQAGHDDPLVGFQAIGDHAQAILLERGRGDAAVLDLVFLVNDVNELDALIRADGPVDHQDGRMRLADR